MNSFSLPNKNLRSPKDIIPRAFPGISQLEIEELIALSQVIYYPATSILCREGSLETKFYILLEGKVEVTKTINNTEERKLKVLEAGDFFGEMAIMHNAPRAASVTAISPVTVLEIEKENFDSVIEHSSTITIAMVREISRRLRENDEMAVEDLKMRANELAQAYQKLAEQDLARREFITNVAHELRTPLMAAGGFLNQLQNKAIGPDKLPDTINTVASNIQHITTLVNDILFLQEMELILPKFQPVNLVAITQEVANHFHEKATANHLTIHIQSEKNLPSVSGDSKSLQRGLMALVDNAIKFSPGGGQIEIRLRKDDNFVVIDVEDHGIGIEPANLSRVFDRFYRSESPGGKMFGGIGLGLAITNQVIKQHHGQLSVKSELGKGSIFSMRLKAINVVF
jgi:signal transduction histidine kinase